MAVKKISLNERRNKILTNDDLSQIEELRLIGVGKRLKTRIGIITVKKTCSTFKCDACAFFYGKCIAPKWIKNPICFANERIDKESVYFRIVK